MDKKRHALSPAKSRESVTKVCMTNAGGVNGEEYSPCDDRHRGEEDHKEAQEPEEHVRVHAVLVELGSASWYRIS